MMVALLDELFDKLWLSMEHHKWVSINSPSWFILAYLAESQG